jgi:hypothetical protein
MPTPRRSPVKSAQQLVVELGREEAIRLTRKERGKARQARSRKEYQFWAAVASEIETSFPIAQSPATNMLPSKAVASGEAHSGTDGNASWRSVSTVGSGAETLGTERSGE